jgi:sorting nexin-41/42
MWETIALDDSPPNEADGNWEMPPPPPNHGQHSESDDEDSAPAPRRKPGGYDSRIEQILYESPELPILITDAGKSVESGGKYIVYTIRTGVSRPLQYPKSRFVV